MKQSLITGKKAQPFESLLNSLYTNISINILHTVLYTSPKMPQAADKENLFINQELL